MAKHHEIIGPATSLLGIALVIITGLHISKVALSTYADEITWVAAVSLGGSIFASYLAIRVDPVPSRFEGLADRCFLIGMATLFLAVVIFALGTI